MAVPLWLSSASVGVPGLIYSLYLATKVTGDTSYEYLGRCIAAFLSMLVCAVYGVVSSAVLRAIGLAGLGQWTTARSYKWLGWLATGVWFEIDDPNNYLGKTRPAVFMGNHQTEMDVLMLAHIFPKWCSVTGKSSLKWWPLLGQFMWLSKTVFIERASIKKAIGAFDKAAAEMVRDKQSVYVFPEGTRSYYDHPDMLPFKKGAFHLAIQAQVPIVAVVVANYSNVLSTKRKVFKAGTIPIKVLEPIETKGKTKDDVNALVEQVRAKMLDELKKISVHAQKVGVALPTAKINGSASAKGSGVDASITGPQAIAS